MSESLEDLRPLFFALEMRVEIETRRMASLTRRQVSAALRWIDSSHLDGLECIRVIERSPLDPHANQFEPYLRGFLNNGHYGYFKGSTRGEIVLYRRDIHFGIPDLFIFTPLAVLKVARHLSHEIGHHLRHRQSRPQKKYRPITKDANRFEEDLANDYEESVVSMMLRHPVYKAANRVNTFISNMYYNAGFQDYSEDKFQSAAKRFFYAYIMNMANIKAGKAYRQAMEKLRIQSPSPLTEAEKHWLNTYYNPFPDIMGKRKRQKLKKIANRH